MAHEDGHDPGQTLAQSRAPERAARAGHYLTLVEGRASAPLVEITGQALVLGRDATLPFCLPDAQVSRAHCELRLLGGNVLVRDLGSTNGTFIDGVRLEGTRLLPLSARLELGRHVLRHERLTPEDVIKREELARELRQARRYVEDLLPPPREQGSVKLEWCFEPSTVLGGDALGYHDLADGRLSLYVLDVCGHGVASAMHSASVLNVLRGHSLADTDFAQPGQVLERLNAAFPMEQHGGMYLSAWYGVFDPASGALRYSSAGHPPALVRGTDGRIRSRLATKNPPLGTLAERRFTEAEASLTPGERLYVYSDGVYELRDRKGREYGLEDFTHELEKSTESRPDEARALHETMCALAGAASLEDDFTLLLLKYEAWKSSCSSAASP